MSLELICKIGYELRRGKIVTFVDRKHLITRMLQGKTKPLQCIQDCSATKSRCNQTKQELSIEIELKYASDEVEEGEKYKNNKGRNLVRECDVNSKTIRCLLESE